MHHRYFHVSWQCISIENDVRTQEIYYFKDVTEVGCIWSKSVFELNDNSYIQNTAFIRLTTNE